jgi:hypothetical protein
MPTDYRDSAERHWEDADYLSADNRLANADHLFGLSAECALKAVMQGLGMSLRPDGAPAGKQHRVHINMLWDEFSAFAQTRNGSRYATAVHSKPNPFDDWDVARRYCHRSEITPTILEKHRQGAMSAIEIFKTAVLDGVIL